MRCARWAARPRRSTRPTEPGLASTCWGMGARAPRAYPGTRAPSKDECMRRVVLVPLLAAFAVTVAALPTSALGASRAACSAPRPGTVSCLARVVIPSRAHPAFAPVPLALPGGYGPLQFHGAYSLPNDTPLVAGTKKTRKKQTIAIVDAYNSPTVFA